MPLPHALSSSLSVVAARAAPPHAPFTALACLQAGDTGPTAFELLPVDQVTLTLRGRRDAPGAVVIEARGLRTAPRVCATDATQCLVALLSPSAALSLFGDALATLADGTRRGEALFDAPSLAALREIAASAAGPAEALRWFEHWLASRPDRLAAAGESARRIAAVTDACLAESAPPMDIARLAALAGVTTRQVQRDFAQHLGISPIAWLRLVRLQRTLGGIARGTPMAELSTAQGFSDQSHMTRELRRWIGVTPGQLLAELARPGSRQLVQALATRVILLRRQGPAVTAARAGSTR